MVRRRINDWNGVTNNSKDHRGRIWILWDIKCMKVDVMHMTDQVIHCKVEDLIAKNKYVLSVVYARNIRKDRSSLWTELQQFSKGLPVSWPWITMGDLNVCREVNEKVGGRKLHYKDVQELAECVELCGIEDTKATGSFFTWTNRHEGSNRILCKLDRCLTNSIWNASYQATEAVFLPHGVSDHSPIILRWPKDARKKNTPFRFFNHWVEHPDFKALVKETWDCDPQGNPMIRVYSKLKILKGKLKGKGGFRKNSRGNTGIPIGHSIGQTRDYSH
ncbi:hypothetical protein FRX31_006814 [Thalictrum thalictroides]|uniref:Dnase i-like superfamily protein n=1 Tax=Thalictrum thalictroides TaxID=46969 RepID=A0A7J6X4V7_THATH|nr:hypothetical protein FRX31_006814 [Thalictrum thalictroides]